MGNQLIVGASYTRKEIAEHFSGELNVGKWNCGIVPVDGELVLLSTGDRDYDDGHRRGGKSFRWQSQNRTTRASKQGKQLLAAKHDDGAPVFLFHRAAAKTKGKANKFEFLGRVECQSSEGECPINIVWRLER